MGVGANHYVISANSGGYSERAGVIWNAGSRAAEVHNLYLLTAAELGWSGLVALFFLFAWPVTRALRLALRKGKDLEGDLALGIAVAMLIASIHSLYEWVFITYQVQYIFAILLGCIAQLLRQNALKPMQMRLRSTLSEGEVAPPV
jgi:O-antigen ligase